jgi:hypothetical protein
MAKAMSTDERPARPGKPDLVMVPSDATLAELVEMFRQLTGREPTPAELEEARRLWEEPESEEPPRRHRQARSASRPDRLHAGCEWPQEPPGLDCPGGQADLPESARPRQGSRPGSAQGIP